MFGAGVSLSNACASLNVKPEISAFLYAPDHVQYTRNHVICVRYLLRLGGNMESFEELVEKGEPLVQRAVDSLRRYHDAKKLINPTKRLNAYALKRNLFSMPSLTSK